MAPQANVWRWKWSKLMHNVATWLPRYPWNLYFTALETFSMRYTLKESTNVTKSVPSSMLVFYANVTFLTELSFTLETVAGFLRMDLPAFMTLLAVPARHRSWDLWQLKQLWDTCFPLLRMLHDSIRFAEKSLSIRLLCREHASEKHATWTEPCGFWKCCVFPDVSCSNERILLEKSNENFQSASPKGGVRVARILTQPCGIRQLQT